METPEQLVALVALMRNHTGKRLTIPAIRRALIDGIMPTDIVGQNSDLFAGQDLAAASAALAKWQKAGHHALSWLDAEYPNQLREVHDFPPIIFTEGQLLAHDYAIAIIGSRTANRNDLANAANIATELAVNGITVASGLAKGIDTAAHQAALKVGARTVAVIGTGIDRYYPAENRKLQDHIAVNGMVLSQFWPGAGPTKSNFPLRNAVMSAYAQSTIIVSAQEHSGTWHQAQAAIKHGRSVVLARPIAENTSWGRTLSSEYPAVVKVADHPRDAAILAVRLAGGRQDAAP